jgi:D-alanine-D-alanine ligase
MAEKLRIGLIFGGRSGEHEVSLLSAHSVRSVLDPDIYQVTEIGITPEGMWLGGSAVLEAFENKQYDALSPVILLPEPQNATLYHLTRSPLGDILEPFARLDVIFPLIHGTFGEDGTLQGLLELADVAYVGGGVLASSVGMDKALFKEVMRANQIPVVDSLLVNRHELESGIADVISQVEASLTYPVFVKPVNLGSSVGVSKCFGASDLVEGLLEAARYDRRIMVEQGVNAREIEVSVLGNDHPQASVIGEVLPGAEFYTYDAKYINDNSELVIPAKVDAALAGKIQATAIKAYGLVDCAGMARVDFLLDRDSNEFFLSEINTIPGFTRISMYPKLWEASGIHYPELVKRLIQLAQERKSERDHTQRIYRRGE